MGKSPYIKSLHEEKLPVAEEKNGNASVATVDTTPDTTVVQKPKGRPSRTIGVIQRDVTTKDRMTVIPEDQILNATGGVNTIASAGGQVAPALASNVSAPPPKDKCIAFIDQHRDNPEYNVSVIKIDPDYKRCGAMPSDKRGSESIRKFLQEKFGAGTYELSVLRKGVLIPDTIDYSTTTIQIEPGANEDGGGEAESTNPVRIKAAATARREEISVAVHEAKAKAEVKTITLQAELEEKRLRDAIKSDGSEDKIDRLQRQIESLATAPRQDTAQLIAALAPILAPKQDSSLATVLQIMSENNKQMQLMMIENSKQMQVVQANAATAQMNLMQKMIEMRNEAPTMAEQLREAEERGRKAMKEMYEMFSEMSEGRDAGKTGWDFAEGILERLVDGLEKMSPAIVAFVEAKTGKTAANVTQGDLKKLANEEAGLTPPRAALAHNPAALAKKFPPPVRVAPQQVKPSEVISPAPAVETGQPNTNAPQAQEASPNVTPIKPRFASVEEAVSKSFGLSTEEVDDLRDQIDRIVPDIILDIDGGRIMSGNATWIEQACAFWPIKFKDIALKLSAIQVYKVVRDLSAITSKDEWLELDTKMQELDKQQDADHKSLPFNMLIESFRHFQQMHDYQKKNPAPAETEVNP